MHSDAPTTVQPDGAQQAPVANTQGAASQVAPSVNTPPIEAQKTLDVSAHPADAEQQRPVIAHGFAAQVPYGVHALPEAHASCGTSVQLPAAEQHMPAWQAEALHAVFNPRNWPVQSDSPITAQADAVQQAPVVNTHGAASHVAPAVKTPPTAAQDTLELSAQPAVVEQHLPLIAHGLAAHVPYGVHTLPVAHASCGTSVQSPVAEQQIPALHDVAVHTVLAPRNCPVQSDAPITVQAAGVQHAPVVNEQGVASHVAPAVNTPPAAMHETLELSVHPVAAEQQRPVTAHGLVAHVPPETQAFPEAHADCCTSVQLPALAQHTPTGHAEVEQVVPAPRNWPVQAVESTTAQPAAVQHAPVAPRASEPIQHNQAAAIARIVANRRSGFVATEDLIVHLHRNGHDAPVGAGVGCRVRPARTVSPAGHERRRPCVSGE